MNAALRSTGTSELDVRALLTYGLWFALCASFGELGMRVVQHNLLGLSSSIGDQYVWMIPVAVISLFLIVTLLLIGLGRAIPALRRPTPVFTVFTFLVLFGPMLTVGRLHPAAILILCLGISAAVSRAAAYRPNLVWTIVRRTLPALCVLIILVPTTVLGTRAWRERSQTASLPPVDGGAPNVLFIILDTVRAKSLEAFGYSQQTTPNLTRLASEGAKFLDAWSTSPWTLPSHGSLFTGQYEHMLSTTLLSPLDDTWPVLAEHFRDRGYRTAGFAANLPYTTRESGLARGFTHYEAYPLSPGMIVNSSLGTRQIVLAVRRILGYNEKLVRKRAPELTDSFLDWARRQDGHPWFVFMNYFDAHAPYLPPDSLSGRFGPERTGWAMKDLSEREDWSPAELREEQAEYEGALAFLDGELGRLFRELDAMGFRDNTLIVVSSDHGEQFGEHGLTDHGNSMYSVLLHVPLIIRFPGRIPAGAVVERTVSMRDAAATIVDLSGQLPAPFPGVSLAPLIQGVPVETSPVLSEVREGIRVPPWLPLSRGPMATVAADGYQYIRNGDGVEELYYLPTDPDALNDIADEPGSEPVLLRLRARMDELRGDRPPYAPSSGARASGTH